MKASINTVRLQRKDLFNYKSRVSVNFDPKTPGLLFEPVLNNWCNAINDMRWVRWIRPT